MKLFDKAVYNILCFSRNKKTLDFFNTIANIDDYNLIIPNLYLGNINYANNEEFLKKNKIGAIINCTKDEAFHSYFNDKPRLRLTIDDSKDPNNIKQFESEIINSIEFIDDCLKNNISVYVHCYWGLMRSATVVAAYLIKTYSMSCNDAISFIREQRPYSLSSLYNFNEILLFVEKSVNN